MRKPRKEWTLSDTARMRDLLDLGCSHGVIAGVTGHEERTVQRRARLLGLKPSHRNPYGTWQSIPALSRQAIAAACGMVAA